MFCCASGIAVCHGIIPADIFHRQIVPLELRGRISHKFPVFFLRYFACSQIKGRKGDAAPDFVFFPAMFRVRTSHFKGSAVNEYHFIVCSPYRYCRHHGGQAQGCEEKQFHPLLLILRLSALKSFYGLIF